MKTTLRFFALILTFLFIQNTEAQKANYTTRQGMTIGFGVGGAYQQSDIANSIGTGYDFTLGSQLYKREGAFFSADWKFRFLAGENKAYDHRINLDGSYSNLNYRFFNYDLELGLSLNRLRERTRIVVTGFVGGGITHGRSFIDQYNENSALYDFSSIDQNQDQKQIYADLMALSDNDFETRVNNKAALLPTAGIFIGYQFSPSFSMGIEHKTNFSLSEQNSFTGINMDNSIIPGSGMDKNHYTTLGFKWNLGRRSSSGSYSGGGGSTTYTPIVTSPPNNNTVVIPNTVTTVSKKPPTVEIIEPQTNPYRTPEDYINIRARILHADGYNEIFFFQDGVKKNNFTYNSYTHILSIGVNLHEGDNSFRITATNSAGTAQARLIVIPDESATLLPAPIVNFTSPTGSRYNANSDRLEVAARVKNVKYKEDIKLILNGRSIVFDYRPEDGTVRATVSLQEGINALNISASNPAGNARDQMEVIYKRAIQAVAPPMLRFINPPSPITIQNNIFLIKAVTENIFSWNDITVRINGSINNNFNFNITGEISANLALAEGLNTIEITGRNESGQRSVKTYITYTKPVRIAPPTINVFSPIANPYRSYESMEEVRASISNVMRRADIIFSINRQNTDNYSFNANTGELVANVALQEGQNVVSISAQNEVGRDAVSINIIKEKKPCPTPEILLPTSGHDLSATHMQSYTFKAKLWNIDSRNQLQLTLNRVHVPFNFNGSTLSYKASLNPGINNFVIIANTECGEDTKMLSIDYIPSSDPLPCLNPVVNFSLIPVNWAGATHELRGTVSNVKRKSGLRLIVNGSTNDNFQFNSGTGAISGIFDFNAGATTVVLNGSNDCGDDSKTVRVSVEEPCLPPEVSFSLIPVDRAGATHELRGTVRNVKSKSGLRLIVNGTGNDNYQFNSGTSAISGSFDFNVGTTTVVLSARNECGNDSKSLSVTLSEVVEEKPCLPPEVSFSLIPVNRVGATHELRGIVSNVKSKSGLRLIVNGSTNDNFKFNSVTGAISGSFNFNIGTTSVVLNTKNECGNDSKTVRVSIEEPCQPPVVSFNLIPVDQVGVTHELRGTVTNIKNKSDISVIINGRADQGFQFVANTGVISAKYKFSPGSTTVVISVRNACGVDSKTVRVSVEEPCQPPVVSFNLIPVDQVGVTHELRGTVTNIKNKSDISVIVNGRSDQGFQFVPNTGVISAKYEISPGATTVVISVKNACGVDSKTVRVSVEEPCQPPVVSFNLIPVDQVGVTHELRGTVTNIKNKSDISVIVNGRADQGFQFVANTGVISAKYKFSPGSTTVVISVKNACGVDSKTVRVSVEEPCQPPVVSFNLIPVDQVGVTHELRGTVTNIKNKSDISVIVNGRSDQGFQFVPNTGAISAKYKFSPGATTVVISVKNACGVDSKTVKVSVEEPCQPPVVSFNLIPVDQVGVTHELRGTVTNIKNKSDISVIVNGRADQGFQFVANTGVISAKYKFSPGSTTVVISVKNACGVGSKTVKVSVEMEEDEPEEETSTCGIRINPGNSAWQFCLQTPRGTYNRESLENKSFSYSGSATSLFFKPIAGGGDAMVNGKPYKMKSGSYYLFTGKLNVKVSSNNPGSMGHWSVCIETDKAPTTGTGNNRPNSPCESE